MIQFLPLGGADEIGASAFYLNIAGTGLLLDCGIHPRKNGIESLPNFEPLENLPLDFVFISHAHQDHIGALPFLVQKFPHVIIYSTKQTIEIAEITLHNAANILSKDENLTQDFKIYTHEEIDLIVKSMREIEYNRELFLKGIRHNSGEPLKIIFHDAGHILGSAGIEIEFNGKRIFYTGDINLSSQSIMTSADLKQAKNINTLILETTYGAADSSKLGTWQSEKNRFAKEANKILNAGGSILVPVFALGKTQEMLATVYDLMKHGKLVDANIYTGGVSKNISKVYDVNRYLVKRTNPNFEIGAVNQIDLSEIQDYNQFKKEPGIVFASSGMMLEGTSSFKLADYWLKQNAFAVFIVGYMDENSPGFKLMNAKKGDEIILGEYSRPQKVNCKVERFYFPSHSKREDLLEIVKFTNPENIILVHGDHESKDWIGFNILRKYPHMKIYSAEINKQISLG